MKALILAMLLWIDVNTSYNVRLDEPPPMMNMSQDWDRCVLLDRLELFESVFAVVQWNNGVRNGSDERWQAVRDWASTRDSPCELPELFYKPDAHYLGSLNLFSFPINIR